MKIRYIILFIFIVFAKCAFAQKDTLVYYLTASGDLAPNRQAAYCRLVVFPVGSGADAKLSAIKAIGNDGKLLFSGSSNKHGFPVHAVGPFTEYYPDGTKKSVKTYSNGFAVGDETDFYPNGKIKSTLQPTTDGDADKMEYFEDGTLSFEHHPTTNHQYKETYYYPDGKVARTVLEDEIGPEVTEYFESGKTKLVENQADKGKKTTTTAYFPNGNLYYKFERGAIKNRVGMNYIECRDSTGKLLVQNGNGYWIEYNEEFTSKSKLGKVVNGYADSVWTILSPPNVGLRETYEQGKLLHSEWFEIKDTTQAAAGILPPAFPGGEAALSDFLGKHVRYPALARENATMGSVVLCFTVGEDGTLSNFRIVSGIGDGCDEEVLRVMKTSPPWTPGKKNGVAVKAEYAIPIHFWLQGNMAGIKLDNL
jgi:TonB family protein